MVDPLTMLAPLTSTPQSDPTSSEEAAKQFETLFVRTLLKEVRKSMDGAGLLGGGSQAAMFGDLFDQELASSIVDSGELGLAAHIQGHLEGISGTADPVSHVPAKAGPIRPVREGRVTSRFGLRTDPLVGDLRHHDGIDLAAPEGTPVFAARSGTVRMAESRGGYGNVVILDHGGGVESRYAHCRDLDVRPGQQIAAGQRIGSVGNTGRSTGPHLHFEVRVDGTAVDPASWLSSSDGKR